MNSLSALFRRWADRHRYEVVRFHDLRHTQAGWLIAKGVNPKVIQERLGHMSYAFTMDVYGGLLKGLEARAADALDDLMNADAERGPRHKSGNRGRSRTEPKASERTATAQVAEMLSGEEKDRTW